jgi:hypothetical protein
MLQSLFSTIFTNVKKQLYDYFFSIWHEIANFLTEKISKLVPDFTRRRTWKISAPNTSSFSAEVTEKRRRWSRLEGPFTRWNDFCRIRSRTAVKNHFLGVEFDPWQKTKQNSLWENCHVTVKSDAIACARRCRSSQLMRWWTQKE